MVHLASSERIEKSVFHVDYVAVLLFSVAKGVPLFFYTLGLESWKAVQQRLHLHLRVTLAVGAGKFLLCWLIEARVYQ